ncbi:MAG: ABC transporter permease [Flavobacteriales bacterium]
MISLISMAVVAFVAAAMVCVMSAFSGMENLVKDLFSNFDAPITIVPREGKMFADSLLRDDQLAQLPGVANYSRIIEEDGWLNYGDNNTVATIKGVEPTFQAGMPLDSITYEGKFLLEENNQARAVVGLGVRSELLMPLSENDPTIIYINAPIRGRKLSRYREEAFNKQAIQVSGIFSANAELDMKYVYVPLQYARDLFGMEDQISSIEIHLVEGVTEADAKAQIQALLPAELMVKTRFDKNALIYQTNAYEKWWTFCILLFILMIASFNIIAALTMLIIEKKKDIYILESLGATYPTIRNAFTLQGIFINLAGALIGVFLGLGLCYAQQTFGLITMEGAVVEYYPVLVKAGDVVLIFFTVVAVGTLFCISLTRVLMRRFAGLN